MVIKSGTLKLPLAANVFAIFVTPYVVLFSYIGGFFSIVHFYWDSSKTLTSGIQTINLQPHSAAYAAERTISSVRFQGRMSR